MGFGDVWNKTLVYFGIAEEEDWDDEGYLTDEDVQRSYAERPNVRRLAPRRSARDFDDWTDPEPGDMGAARGRRGAARPELGARPPCAAAELQRRAADRGQVQAGDPGDPEPPELGLRAREAADRLRQ